MIVVQLLGGMGNQMFQYAVGKHLALKNNTTLKLDISFLTNRVFIKDFTFRDFDLDIFNITGQIAAKSDFIQYNTNYGIKSIPHRLLHLGRVIFSGFKYVRYPKVDYDVKILTLKGNLYLEGYWQSYKYFEEISDTIREEFEPRFPISNMGEPMLVSIQNSNSVCIHIRRTDYLRLNSHLVIGKEFISKALKIILNNVKDPVLFIFSDDIEWCKQNLKFTLPYHFIEKEIEGPKTRDNFLLMRSCKHFIIPNSSYSWWAAWLSKNESKIVVAPQQWIENAKTATNDLLPDNWFKI